MMAFVWASSWWAWGWLWDFRILSSTWGSHCTSNQNWITVPHYYSCTAPQYHTCTVAYAVNTTRHLPWPKPFSSIFKYQKCLQYHYICIMFIFITFVEVDQQHQSYIISIITLIGHHHDIAHDQNPVCAEWPQATAHCWKLYSHLHSHEQSPPSSWICEQQSWLIPRQCVLGRNKRKPVLTISRSYLSTPLSNWVYVGRIWVKCASLSIILRVCSDEQCCDI